MPATASVAVIVPEAEDALLAVPAVAASRPTVPDAWLEFVAAPAITRVAVMAPLATDTLAAVPVAV